MLKDIFASSQIFQNFLSSVRSGKALHTHLLISKDATSAFEMAKLFAQALLCKDMCGQCQNCQKVISLSHPDLKIYPESNKLLVEDSKKIVEESAIKPIFSDKKVFIIKDIDASTIEAQNKLLKSLEEPNSSIFYILTTANPQKVLPTILSRCNKLEIGRLSEEQLSMLVEGDNIELARVLGGGYLSKTISLAKKSNLFELASLAIGLLKDTSSSKEALNWSKRLIDVKTDFSLVLEIFSIAIEDVIFIKTQKEDEIRLKMFEQELKMAAENLSIKCLISLSPLLTKAQRELDYNVNLSLVADNLVMNILEVKYLCK